MTAPPLSLGVVGWTIALLAWSMGEFEFVTSGITLRKSSLFNMSNFSVAKPSFCFFEKSVEAKKTFWYTVDTRINETGD